VSVARLAAVSVARLAEPEPEPAVAALVCSAACDGALAGPLKSAPPSAVEPDLLGSEAEVPDDPRRESVR
jgi:hypothetical protein